MRDADPLELELHRGAEGYYFVLRALDGRPHAYATGYDSELHALLAAMRAARALALP